MAAQTTNEVEAFSTAVRGNTRHRKMIVILPFRRFLRQLKKLLVNVKSCGHSLSNSEAVYFVFGTLSK